MNTTFSVSARRTFLLVAAALAGSTIAHAQAFISCKDFERVAGKTANPISARTFERIVSHSPDGTEYVTEFPGSEARDSSGRVSLELRFDASAQRNSDKTNPATRTEPSRFGFKAKSRINSMVFISDCPDGQEITMYPDIKIARLAKGRSASPSQQPRPQVTYFESLVGRQLPSNVLFEDLGFKEIDGIETHGYRTTVIGTEIDAEWEGKTTSVAEYWVTDELALTVLEIRTDLKGKTESRLTRMDIKREEPPASLFQIPPDYAINPSQPQTRLSRASPASNIPE